MVKSPSQLNDKLTIVPTDFSKVSFGVDDLNDVKSKDMRFDLIENIIYPKIDNIAALTTLGSFYKNNDIVTIKDHTANDNGGGNFRLDTSGALGPGAGNNGTIIATNGPTDSYFLRILDPPRQITPQMFNAKGDGTNDDSDAVQNASNACDLLNALSVVRPRFYFPSAISYRCVSPITVNRNIHIWMDTAIKHDGTDSTIGLIVGTVGSRNEGVQLHLRMERNGISDWTDEGSIGIKLINSDTCDIFAEVNTLAGAGGFTIGLQCMGSGIGFVNSSVRLGYIGNNKTGLDLTNETVNGTHTGSSEEPNVLTDDTQRLVVNSLVGEIITNLSDLNGETPSTGTVTSNTVNTITCSGGLSGGADNDWDNGDLYKVGVVGWSKSCQYYGGRFFCFEATHDGIDRQGIRLTGEDKTANNNAFFYPSIECRVECIPVLVVHGQKNRFFGCRTEGNSSVFAKVLHDDDQINHANVFGIGRGTGFLVQQGNAAGNFLTTDDYAMSYSPAREVFDSGSMHENAVWYNGTKVHVPNVHIADGSIHGRVSQNGLSFSVSEVFTTNFASDNEKLLDTAHTRQNDDIVFLTTADTLPGGTPPVGLEIEKIYYVIEKDTNDFKLSLTLRGSAVAFDDDGTGEHKYHGRDRYLTIGTGRSVGIEVETDQAHNFIFTRDTEVDGAGKFRVRAYNVAGKQLQNEEEFTIDDGNDELIQVEHTLVVNDRITCTTDDTLPVDLRGGGDFYVISVDDTAAGRFRVSATEGGSTVTDLSGGSGTHTYHLSYNYVTGFPELFWNSTHGGVYIQGSDNALEQQFNVRDEAVRIDVLIGKGAADCKIRRFQISTTDREVIPATRTAYDGQRDQALATQAPTLGVYLGKGKTIRNNDPLPGKPTEWTLAVPGVPGTWDVVSRSVQQPETATGTITLQSGGSTSIDSSGGAVTATLEDGDFIGQQKTIVMTNASNSSTLVVNDHILGSPIWTYTFDDTDDGVVLTWDGTQWLELYATATGA